MKSVVKDITSALKLGYIPDLSFEGYIPTYELHDDEFHQDKFSEMRRDYMKDMGVSWDEATIEVSDMLELDEADMSDYEREFTKRWGTP